jgi:UDP-GlcNAc:undecaprenyl-phosphate GlcNAc-1-phosphate transferase
VRWRVPEIQVQIPLLVLALPLFDLLLAFVRRALRGQSIFAGDSDHIHHRLLATGLSHGRAVAVLWLSTAMFATMGYLNVVGVGGWWTLLGTTVAMAAASVLLGYHRLLARLPAFTGERRVGWRDRRREVMEILAMIETLRRGPKDRGVERWRRLAPDVAPVLVRLGVPAFEVRRGPAVVVAQGDPSDAWAFLGLPLPGSEGAELRLALAVRLPDLQQEQLMLLERVVTLMAGTELAARQSTASIEVAMAKISPPEGGAAIPPRS